MTRVKNTAVTKLIKIDKRSMVANPLTLLVPKINSTMAAISVVKLASTIVHIEDDAAFL